MSKKKKPRKSRTSQRTSGKRPVGARSDADDEQAPAGPADDGDRSQRASAMAKRTRALADRAMKYADNDELRAELEQLSPEEAAVFVLLVEKQLKKRRLQLLGYALSLLVFLLGMLLAFYLYANREPGEFMGWAFLLPFIVVAGMFMLFGQLSKRA